MLPPEFVLDYERLAREIIKQQSNVAANNSNVTDTVRPFLSATLFVIGTCYIDQGVSLRLIFDIVFIFYKTLPVHCIYVLLGPRWLNELGSWIT